MKILEKITLILYSIIVLFISVYVSLMIFNVLNAEPIINCIVMVKKSPPATVIVLCLSIIFMLLSIKCIFFGTKKSDFYKDNILLGNEEGRLIITKASIENSVNNVIKGFSNMQEYSVKAKLDKQNNIYINVDITINENVIVQELSENIKEKVKHSIKRSFGLDTKEINIKIKNVKKKEDIIKE